MNILNSSSSKPQQCIQLCQWLTRDVYEKTKPVLTAQELADMPYFHFKTLLRDRITTLIPEVNPADKQILWTLSEILKESNSDSEIIFQESYHAFRSSST